jgi:hypothetical protein
VTALLGCALAIVGAVSSVAMVLAGLDARGALGVAVCGVIVCGVASRAPRWWP